MTPEKWNKIKALFSSAQDHPIGERSRFLSHACGGDAELRNEVERLLASYGEDDGFLERSAVENFAGLVDELQTGDGPGNGWAAEPRFAEGDTLNGRYEIRRLIGRGGMGEVYLAHDMRIDRSVALKVLHADLIASKDSLRRFALEAQAVSALNHPHIMTIHEFDATGDSTVFFIAEFVDGHTLNHLIGTGPPIDKVLDIAIQVLSALAAAHDAGITHRDIKPENIMIRRDGYVKVLDFGLAKLSRRTGSDRPHTSGSEDVTRALDRTRPGSIMGTAAYMSPEQARGLEVGPRTDLWSVGVVLYELITGTRPFAGETSADTLVSVLSKEPPPMSDSAAELPGEIEWIVTKALSKDAEGRYQTAEEFRSDLERVRKQLLGRSAPSQYAPALVLASNDDGSPHGRATAEPVYVTAEATPEETAGGEKFPIPASPPWTTPLISPLISKVFTTRAGRSVAVSIAAILLAGTILAAMYVALNGRGGGARADIDSIAVLPFENRTGDPADSFISDGISDALIDRLSELAELRVISRNSSSRFRGSSLDARDMAAALGVGSVLTGSVSRSGDEIVVRYDIFDAAGDRQLAGGEFRRRSGDLRLIQGEIAAAVADKLRLRLTAGQSKRLASVMTDNSEAYRYYLAGLVELNSGPADMQDRALEYFEKAVELDPGFAPPFAEIGWIYWYRANGNDDPHKLMPKAKAAASQALDIDPGLAKAHVVMGAVSEYEYDWTAAEGHYRRAIELSPNLGDARNSYALYLSVMGRSEEALGQLDQQASRDPLNRYAAFLWKGAILAAGRKFDEALKAYQDAKAVEPGKDIQPIALGYAYAGKGLYRDAAEYYQKAADEFGGERKYSQPLVYLAAAYARIPDKRGEAVRLLDRMNGMSGYRSPALMAVIYTELGKKDEAMRLLERAFIERDLLLRYIGTAYEYDPLRDDPRFKDLLRRMNLPG